MAHAAKRKLMVLAGAGLAIIALAGWLWHHSTSGTTPGLVSRLLAEHVPAGTHIDDVTAWLRSQPFPASEAFPFVKKDDARAERRAYGALIGNANVDLLFPGRIVLHFE